MSYAEPDWPFATLQRLAVLPAQTGQEEKRGKAVESFLHLLLHDLDLVLFL
jgi:hypothetical protein